MQSLKDLEALITKVGSLPLYKNSKLQGGAYLKQVCELKPELELLSPGALGVKFVYGFFDRFVIEKAQARIAFLEANEAVPDVLSA